MKFPQASRLTRRNDIERVRKEGKAFRVPDLMARVSASPFSHQRVGVVVPRYGRSVVDRNRLKRRLRDLVRNRLLQQIPAVDVVIWAQPGSYARTFAQLAASVESLAGHLQKHS